MCSQNTCESSDKLYDPDTETIEDLQRASMRLIQPKTGFRYGMDSVLLADFAADFLKGPAVDLGAGGGVISVLLAARKQTAGIDLVEIDPRMADIARRNIALNGLSDRLRAYTLDMREAAKTLGYEKYALAVSNPPYFDADADIGDIARRNAACSPNDLAKAAFSLLKNGGRFCAVFPAARALSLLMAMDENRIRPRHIRCVQDTARSAPKLLLIEGVKLGGEGLLWTPPLLLRDESGLPTAEYKKIYGI